MQTTRSGSLLGEYGIQLVDPLKSGMPSMPATDIAQPRKHKANNIPLAFYGKAVETKEMMTSNDLGEVRFISTTASCRYRFCPSRCALPKEKAQRLVRAQAHPDRRSSAALVFGQRHTAAAARCLERLELQRNDPECDCKRANHRSAAAATATGGRISEVTVAHPYVAKSPPDANDPITIAPNTTKSLTD